MRNKLARETRLVHSALLTLLALPPVSFAACAADDTNVAERKKGNAHVYQPSVVPGYAKPGETCSTRGEDMRDAAYDEKSGLGFSGSDVLTLFNERAHGALEWSNGGTATISLRATAAAARVTYDEPPLGQDRCVPTLTVLLDELRIESSDGVLDARIVPRKDKPVELVAEVDRDADIGMIFPSIYDIDLEAIDSPLVAQAAAVHPEHDRRYFGIEFSLSMDGQNAYCLVGQEVSSDANERCNSFDGVVRYASVWSPGTENIHDIPPGTYYNQALATWHWTP